MIAGGPAMGAAGHEAVTPELAPVACQNPCRASDLGFYPQRSCSFASPVCS